MNMNKLPWWMFDTTKLIGAEDPPEGGAGNEGEGDQGGEGDEGGNEGGPEKVKPEDVTGLKSALDKERRENARKDRELARLQKAEKEREDAEKTEVQRAKEEAETANTRAARLAEGFRDERINNAIITAANKANFFDPEDAVLAVDRDAISWDQDEDNPAQVKIDRKTVENAVKKLATSKPHLVKSGTSDQGPTGGQFGAGNNSKNKGEADEATYQLRYPAL